MATVRGLSNKSNALAKESPYCWRRIFPPLTGAQKGQAGPRPARGDQDVGAYGRKASDALRTGRDALPERLGRRSVASSIRAIRVSPDIPGPKRPAIRGLSNRGTFRHARKGPFPDPSPRPAFADTPRGRGASTAEARPPPREGRSGGIRAMDGRTGGRARARVGARTEGRTVNGARGGRSRARGSRTPGWARAGGRSWSRLDRTTAGAPPRAPPPFTCFPSAQSVVVPEAGLEPARPEGQRGLSSPCLHSTIRAGRGGPRGKAFNAASSLSGTPLPRPGLLPDVV